MESILWIAGIALLGLFGYWIRTARKHARHQAQVAKIAERIGYGPSWPRQS